MLLVGAGKHDCIVQCHRPLECDVGPKWFLQPYNEQLNLLYLGDVWVATGQRHEVLGKVVG
jgi:hypothetical protein